MQPPKKKKNYSLWYRIMTVPVQTSTIVGAVVFSYYSADGKLYFSAS